MTMRALPFVLALLLPLLAAPSPVAADEPWVLEAPVTMEDVERVLEHRQVCFRAAVVYRGLPVDEYFKELHSDNPPRDIRIGGPKRMPFDRLLGKQEMREPLRALLDVPPRCDMRLDAPVTAEMRRKVRSGRHFEATFAPPLTCRLMGRVQEIGSILLPLDKAFLHPSSGQILIGERLVNPTTIYVFPLPMPRELLVDYVGANRQP